MYLLGSLLGHWKLILAREWRGVFSLLQGSRWKHRAPAMEQGEELGSLGPALYWALPSQWFCLIVPGHPHASVLKPHGKGGAVCCISPTHVMCAQVSHTDTQTLGASLIRESWQARGHGSPGQVSLITGCTASVDNGKAISMDYPCLLS